MKSQQHPQDYWDTNIDIQNLGATFDGEDIDLEREIAFWNTPDQQWVYERLGDVRGKKIIDLGGGLSVNAIVLARKGATVFVADISIQRLRVLKHFIRRIDAPGSIIPLCAMAEHLPLQDEYIDFVTTKSVLIHTNLEETMREIRRVLKPGGAGFFTEPTTSNPFANLYRTLFAPKEWQEITRYFDASCIQTIRSIIPATKITRFYLTGFLAFFWQFGYRNLALFRLSLNIFKPLDALLFRMGDSFKKSAWFLVIQSTKKP